MYLKFAIICEFIYLQSFCTLVSADNVTISVYDLQQLGGVWKMVEATNL